MKTRIVAIVCLCLFGIVSATQMAIAGEVNPGDKITIITPGTVARLCPYPSCGQNEQIARIPKGTVLKVEKTQVVNSGMAVATWCQVTYNNKKGWVSIYDTNKG